MQEPSIQDSVVAGDVHVGDVHSHETNVDQSTNVDLSSLDQVTKNIGDAVGTAAASGKDALIGLGTFTKSFLNKLIILLGLTILLIGFLIYNGNIDANAWIESL